MRSGAQGRFRWCADIIMMAAALAFTFQGTFIAQAAPGINGHYHHGYGQHRAALKQAKRPDSKTHDSKTHDSKTHDSKSHDSKSHVVTHVHKDGTVHKHAVDDGARALQAHEQEPGCPCCWNMAIVTAVLPLLPVAKLDVIPGRRIAIENLDPFRGTEPDGPRRPPRTPSIA